MSPEGCASTGERLEQCEGFSSGTCVRVRVMLAAFPLPPMSLRPARMNFFPLTFLVVTACVCFAQEPEVAKAVPVTTRDVTTQLQIFLDQQLFGPGKIDGRPGEFVGKALRR